MRVLFCSSTFLTACRPTVRRSIHFATFAQLRFGYEPRGRVDRPVIVFVFSSVDIASAYRVQSGSLSFSGPQIR